MRTSCTACASEGKGGNPLNEVRMSCNSLMNGDGALQPGNTIKYVSAKSVLKLEVGQATRLDARNYARISAAFIDEIERKYL